MNKFILKFIFLAFLVLIPVIAFAAGGGSSEHGHHPSILDLKWFWVNFLIYVAAIWIIVLYSKPGMRRSWEDRKDKLDSLVNQGKNELIEAQNAFDSISAKISNVEGEKRQLAESSKVEGELEIQEIVRIAKEKAENIVERANETVSAERRATEQIVKDELADYVLKRASERLKSELNENSDKPLREAAVGNINALAN